ncbi:MAG: hypothetical protein LBH54_06510 [Clostridiales bacterium]|nr:hypothetical protein [Clostridiales bacterium]
MNTGVLAASVLGGFTLSSVSFQISVCCIRFFGRYLIFFGDKGTRKVP